MDQSTSSSCGTRTQVDWPLIYWTAVSFLILVAVTGALFKPFQPDQFVYLANNLVHGRLSVDDMPLIYPDYVRWNNHIYLPFGPLPALVLVPFLPLIHA